MIVVIVVDNKNCLHYNYEKRKRIMQRAKRD